MDTIVKLPFWIKNTPENQGLVQKYIKTKFQIKKNETKPGDGMHQRTGPDPTLFQEFESSLLSALDRYRDLQNSRDKWERDNMHYDLYLLEEDDTKKTCYVNSEGEIRVL